MKALPAYLTVLALAAAAGTAAAQTAPEPSFTLNCQNGGGGWTDKRRGETVCETRDLTLAAPVGQPLTVEGGDNGSISVRGWDGPDVRVRARVQSWDADESAAQTRLEAIRITSENNTLRAEGPAGATRRGHYHAVNYEIFVPRKTALVLHTVNGGVSVENVQADVRFDAVNGGVSLSGLGGQVAGRTVNGGLSITLSGRQWEGAGLDVETTNGGITWRVPTDYSARLFTRTSAGGIATSLPITTSGYVKRELSATLGQGGAPLRAVTTNGGISVKQAAR